MRWRLYILIVLAVVGLSSCSFSYLTTKTYQQYAADGPYDAIIVPGVPYDSAQPNSLFKARMVWAKELYDRGIARNIIFSGAAVHTPYVESKVMKLYANAMGIPASHTFIEIRATRSNENVFYGYRIAKQLGFKKIALATDPFQSFCYGLFSRVYATDLARLPASMDSLLSYAQRFENIEINPASAYVADFVPVEKPWNPGNYLRYSFGRLGKRGE
jgi:uncharacterized SAM-binding protein YcdF (DUF218 family)